MKKPHIIGVTGGSGSGKTQFVRQLVKDFNKEEVCLVSQDNYYREREEQPVDPKGFQNFDLPGSMELDKFQHDVLQLMAGKEIVVKEYTFNNPNIKPGNIYFYPAPILILEGIYVLYLEEIRDLMDVKIFVHAMEHIMLSRRIIRDEEERGYDLEDVLYRYQNHVMPSYRKHILPFKETCDIVVNNNSSFDRSLKMLRSYMRDIISG